MSWLDRNENKVALNHIEEGARGRTVTRATKTSLQSNYSVLSGLGPGEVVRTTAIGGLC